MEKCFASSLPLGLINIMIPVDGSFGCCCFVVVVVVVELYTLKELAFSDSSRKSNSLSA